MSIHDVETYCDARGVEMPAMSFSDALHRLLALATRNLPDEHDLARDSGLYEERRRLRYAIYATQKLLSENAALLDERYSPPENWDDEYEAYVHAPNLIDDPYSIPSVLHNLKVTAEAAMPDSMSISGIQDAEEFDLDQQALELTSALIYLHGRSLERALRDSLLNRKR
jgi:hypothetical protein